MKVSEIMTTDVATCQIGDNVNHAAQLMWERNCGCVPVLDREGAVVGMLTDRDACMASYTQGRPMVEIPVSTAMTRDVQGCDPSASIDEVLQKMMINRVCRLVVAEPGGRIEGLISLDDIARTGAARDGKNGIDLEKVALTMAEIAKRTGPDGAPLDIDPDQESVREIVRNSLDALKTLRDEIRVDLNLAGKEMHDHWKRLEGQVHLAEIRAGATRAFDSATSLRAAIENVREFRNSLRRPESNRPRSETPGPTRP